MAQYRYRVSNNSRCAYLPRDHFALNNSLAGVSILKSFFLFAMGLFLLQSRSMDSLTSRVFTLASMSARGTALIDFQYSGFKARCRDVVVLLKR